MAAQSKKILITLTDSPLGDYPVVSKMRTALGITAGYKEHGIDLLFTGDAVLVLHLMGENEELEKMLRTFKMLGSGLYFDQQSIEERKVETGDLPNHFHITGRSELPQFYEKADFSISL